MGSLSNLHEGYIAASKVRLPVTSRLPIDPKVATVPVIPVDRWTKSADTLVKTYKFRLKAQRNDFIKEVLEHEDDVGHCPEVVINDDTVILTLQTRDVAKVTELDKEFAKWADELFRDVVYSSDYDE